MYEFMKQTVVYTAFLFITMFDIYMIGKLLISYVKRLGRKRRKKTDDTQ